MDKDFLKGVGSAIDIGGEDITPPKIKSVAKAFRADKEKLFEDWKKVGGDLSKVLKKELGVDRFEELNRIKIISKNE